MDPRQRAIEVYREGLTAEEKVVFAYSTPKDILDDVAKQDAAQRESSKTRAFGEKLQPLLASIEQYGKALDVISNSSPTILSPIWGSLRILLRVAKEFNKYYSELLRMLERIGDVLPRYSTYSTLFSKHAPLQEALSDAYLQIITFLMDAKKVFSKSPFRLASRDAMWKSFDTKFETSIVQWRRSRDKVEDSARLASMIELIEERREAADERLRMKHERKDAAENREKVKEIKDAIGNREQETRTSSICKWLKARLCLGEKETLLKLRLQGSCEWILAREELSKWKHNRQHQILWIYGPPGCGKSYLYATLLESLDTLNIPVLYFLFCDGDGERTSVYSLIRSWTCQIVQKFPEAMEVSETFRNNIGQPTATSNEVLKLFRFLLEKLPKCYLTVDGLDECSDRGEFLALLPHIPEQFQILILSRESPDIKNAILQQSEKLVLLPIRPETTQPDIDLYISTRLLSDYGSLPTHITDQIRLRLSDCNGMFLWVRLMFEQLKSQTCPHEILECLNRLPKSLNETYDRALERINKLDEPQPLLAHKVFFWIRIAHRPVSVTELCTLLAIRPNERKLDRNRILLDAENMIESICSPLIQIRDPGNLVFAVHFTVSQYLEQYLKNNNILEKLVIPSYGCDLTSGSSLAAAVCLTYLSLPVVAKIQKPRTAPEASKIVDANNPSLELLSYSSYSWFEHLRDVSRLDRCLEDLAIGFLRGNVPNMENWWHVYWFSGSDSNESAICPSQFSGLHVAAYFALPQLIRILVRDSNPLVVDSSGRSPLWWAASSGQAGTVTALLDAGLDPNAPDNHSITPVHRAAALGHKETFDIILSRQENLTELVQDSEGWTPLHWAASRNQHSIISSILDYRTKWTQYGSRTSITVDGRTPLHLAALNGHATAIADLAGFFSAHYSRVPNIQDTKGITALHLAAMHNHRHVVEKLVLAMADMTLRDHSGKTAAEKAHMMGDDGISSYLKAREHGISSNSADCSVDLESTEKIGTALAEYGMKPFRDLFATKMMKSNSRDWQDASVLQTSVNGHYLNLRILVDKGRNWWVADDRGRTTLHHSAAGGYDDCVKMILRHARENIGDTLLQQVCDAQDDRGWTALHYCTAGNFHTTTALLLSAGASPKLVNKSGLTPYDIAVHESFQAVMEAMAKFASFLTEDLASDFKWTELHCQARDGNLQQLQSTQLLLEDLRCRDIFGRLPIYRAAELGNYEVVKTLANPSQLNPEDTFELAILSSHNIEHKEIFHFFLTLIPSGMLLEFEHLQIEAHQLFIEVIERNDAFATRALCEAGVDVKNRDHLNPRFLDTPLHLAIQNKCHETARLLIQSGASISIFNACGLTPLHTAYEVGVPDNEAGLHDVITILLARGADPNKQVPREHLTYQNKERKTPLHSVVRALCYETPETITAVTQFVKTLLNHGADVNIENSDGQSPAWQVLESYYKIGNRRDQKVLESYSELLELLKQRRPCLFQPTSNEGFSPLHIALAGGDIDKAKENLDSGVPVDWRTFKYPYATPLRIAVEHRQLAAVELLLEYGANMYAHPWAQGYLRKKQVVDISRELGYDEITEVLLAEHKRRGQDC